MAAEKNGGLSMNKTIAKIGYAILEETTAGVISYKKITWFKSDKAGGRSIGAEPNGETTTIYADGLPVVIAEENAGYNISLELIAIIDDVEKDWFGNEETTDGGIIEKGGAKEKPRFALLAAKERFNSNTVYEIDTYFDCIASRTARNDKTSEGKLDPQFPTVTITSRPRTDDKFVRYTSYCDTLPEEVTTPVIKTVEGEV